MGKRIEIEVVTRLQDLGDGSYVLYAYNNEDELIAAHPKFKNRKPTEEERLEVLDEHDPIENGYMGSDTITIYDGDDGTYKLTKPLRFHVGQ
ncbi:MAG TPA: hypothetical protein VMW36_01120 [Patescibacteria group bacterium]|nr:hypothetical protein [Patescibacteria group bacterium]